MLILGALLCGGCSNSSKPAAADKKELLIGLTVSESGGYAFASEQGFKGIQLWEKEVNKAGGLQIKALGKKLPVRLVYYDDRSDKQQVPKLYDKLIKEDKVDILFAPFGSTLTSAAAVITEKYKIPMIVWSGAADSIYSQGYKYIISATQNAASLMPEPEINHMNSLGIKKVAIAYIDEPFPAQQALGAKDTAEKLGMQVVLYEKFVKENLDYNSIINKAKAAGAESFYVSAYMEEQANFVRQMKERSIAFDYIYMVYSGQTNWPDLTGDDGLYIFGHTVFDPKVKWKVTRGLDTVEFANKFKEYFPNAKNAADFQTALAYGAGVMIGAYLEQSPSMQADEIKKAALALSGKETLITGQYKIDETGKQLGMSWVVTQVAKDGTGGYSLDIVYPKEVATKAPLYPFPAWDKRK
jgi:branched-chain amino acid transport system substrate-binding protein